MISTKRIATICLALFVFAGYYKAADPLQFVPIDLTLLFWAATAGFCLIVLWRQRRLLPGMLPMFLIFAALAFGLHWPEELGAYPAQKELRLFSLTALSAIAPIVLLQEEDERRVFLHAIAALGIVMAICAAIEVAGSGKLTRIGVFNTNPILLARASGFAALMLCLLYWSGRARVWIFVPAVAVAMFGLFVSGSRGPLLALLVTTAPVMLLCHARTELRARLWGTVLVGIAGLTAAVIGAEAAGTSLSRRILRLFSGEWGDTEVSRWALWRQTLDLIAEFPLGVGWGRVSAQVEIYHDGILLLHPHNIFLEIAAEAGWFAAVVFIVTMGVVTLVGFRSAYKETRSFRDHDSLRTLVVFSASTYWLVCALFSGDVNDNRPLWAMVGMALVAQGNWRARGFANGNNDGGRPGGNAEPY
ncbi:MAG: O-antigen ligase family protein [Kiloniellaceae bacterium]